MSDNDELFHKRLQPGEVVILNHPPMLEERYKELMTSVPAPSLTQEELNLGWHFCWDWDGLLVGPDMVERRFCQCIDWNSKKPRRSLFAGGL